MKPKPWERGNRSDRFGDRTRINNQIRIPEVRCIAEDGSQLGIMPTYKANEMALAAGLDLVEISPQAKPPVCKIMNYGKFKYEKEKKEKLAKKNQTQTKVKEIKFHANVGDHDYNTKIRQATDFLNEGHRVKFSLFFRGRENAHKEIGFELMERVAVDLTEIGEVEQTAKFVGRNLIMMVFPKKSKA
ncbi:MAG: translation initiation factor IF-3 [Spartobacteria bacterium]|nr:translation initiation factor IF-3 [Spartobacteria bacterium]